MLFEIVLTRKKSSCTLMHKDGQVFSPRQCKVGFKHKSGVPVGDVVYAELQTLAMGLRFLWRKNWNKIICGMDCLEVFVLLNREESISIAMVAY